MLSMFVQGCVGYITPRFQLGICTTLKCMECDTVYILTIFSAQCKLIKINTYPV